MAASEGLLREFNSLFSGRVWSINGNSRYRGTNNVAFGHYLEVPLGKTHIEYPLWARSDIESCISSRETLKVPQLEKVIIPCYTTQDLGKIKTADSMLKKFFDSVGRLCEAVNGNNTIYYGGRGIVFDSNFTLLMCIYLTADKIDNAWKYGQPIIKIHPTVFQAQQEFMAKAIIQKVIPMALEERTLGAHTIGSGVEIQGCKIEIENTDKLMVSPPKPSPNSYSDKLFNQVLRSNVDDIISLVQ